MYHRKRKSERFACRREAVASHDHGLDQVLNSVETVAGLWRSVAGAWAGTSAGRPPHRGKARW
ncbi:hypothetical protein YT1_p20080 (plasmid) [Rhodococcus ruber]|nr:hypothetical protein YT1_p20080 [Rhodococcus ruber]